MLFVNYILVLIVIFFVLLLLGDQLSVSSSRINYFNI